MKVILISLILLFSSYSYGENRYKLENIRVLDGDTVNATIVMDFNISLVKKTIRISNFDAWEISRRRKSVEVTSEEIKRGQLAKAELTGLMRESAAIYIVPLKNTDQYGRILGRLLVDGEDVGEFMKNRGHERKNLATETPQ